MKKFASYLDPLINAYLVFFRNSEEILSKIGKIFKILKKYRKIFVIKMAKIGDFPLKIIISRKRNSAHVLLEKKMHIWVGPHAACPNTSTFQVVAIDELPPSNTSWMKFNSLVLLE